MYKVCAIEINWPGPLQIRVGGGTTGMMTEHFSISSWAPTGPEM